MRKNEEIVFTAVPQDRIIQECIAATDFLTRASHSSGGRYDATDLLLEASNGRMTMWVCYKFSEDGNDLLGIVFTSVLEYPKKRALSIRYMSGVKLKSWWQIGYQTLCSYAKDAKCGTIEAVCRPGWLRYGQKIGIKPTGFLIDWTL